VFALAQCVLVGVSLCIFGGCRTSCRSDSTSHSPSFGNARLLHYDLGTVLALGLIFADYNVWLGAFAAANSQLVVSSAIFSLVLRQSVSSALCL
jgi:hypothetical protein